MFFQSVYNARGIPYFSIHNRNTPTAAHIVSCSANREHVVPVASTDEILATVPHDVAVPSNQMMVAKVAVNSEGRVTHLRVIRLAWPKLPNSRAINRQAVDSIKRWHHSPTTYDGKPVAVCSDVSVTVDLD